MNSWGSAWGDKGYFYLPYDYLQYMSDLWTMKFFT
jgi:C1A family cysteine protease